MPSTDPLSAAVAVRRFNHFYARHVGGLQERLRQSPFSTAEVRVLHALTHERLQTAAQIARGLELDTGYLSRILVRLEDLGLVVRQKAVNDARKHLVILTKSGLGAFEKLDAGSIGEMGDALRRFADGERAQLMASMADIERLLSPPANPQRVTLRGARRGDFGWIVERCALLASSDMEARAASIVARFLDANRDASNRNACWIAEQDQGSRVGAALMMISSDELACIELLFVEPGARRQRHGMRLVQACRTSASKAGYSQLSCTFDDTYADLHAFAASMGFETADRGWRRSLACAES